MKNIISWIESVVLVVFLITPMLILFTIFGGKRSLVKILKGVGKGLE